MKLHLPSRLRKALLACLAVLKSRVVPRTLSTASLLLGSVWFAWQSSATADTPPPDDSASESAVSSLPAPSLTDEDTQSGANTAVSSDEDSLLMLASVDEPLSSPIALEAGEPLVWGRQAGADSLDVVWQDSKPFTAEGTNWTDGSDATFGEAEQAANKKVKVEGAVTAGTIAITADGYTFSGHTATENDAEDSISATTLSIGGEADTPAIAATFGVTTTVSTLTGSGNLTVSGGAFTISQAIDSSNYTGAISVTGGDGLNLTGGGTLTSLTLAAGTTLKLGGNLTIEDPTKLSAGSSGAPAAITGIKTTSESGDTYMSLTLGNSSNSTRMNMDRDLYVTLTDIAFKLDRAKNAGSTGVRIYGDFKSGSITLARGMLGLYGNIGEEGEDGNSTKVDITQNKGTLNLGQADTVKQTIYGDILLNGGLNFNTNGKELTIHGDISAEGSENNGSLNFRGEKLTIDGQVALGINEASTFSANTITISQSDATRGALSVTSGTVTFNSSVTTLSVTGGVALGGGIVNFKAGTITINQSSADNATLNITGGTIAFDGADASNKITGVEIKNEAASGKAINFNAASGTLTFGANITELVIEGGLYLGASASASSSAAINFNGTNQTITGDISLSRGTINVGANAALTVSGALNFVDSNSPTLSLGSGATITLSKLSGTGSSQKINGVQSETSSSTVVLKDEPAADEAATFAGQLNSVTFRKTGSGTLTLTGTISKNDSNSDTVLNIEKGTVNLGEQSGTNAITAGSLTIGSSGEEPDTTASVVVNTTGAKNFGSGVTVNEGSRLVVTTGTGWDNNAGVVSGEGTLELNGFSSNFAWNSTSNTDDGNWLSKLIGGSESRTIAHVELTGSTSLTLGNSNVKNNVANVKNWIVSTGTALLINSDNAKDILGAQGSLQADSTVHLNGGRLQVNHGNNANGTYTVTVTRQVVIAEGSTIQVGNGGTYLPTLILSQYNTGEPAGGTTSLTLGSYTLKKTGEGTLQLGSGETDVWTVSASAGAGIDVQAGKLALNYKENEAGSKQLKDVVVKLAKGTSMVLHGNYTIAGLGDSTAGGSGDVVGSVTAGEDGTAKLTLAGSGSTSGAAVNVDLAVSAGTHTIGSLGSEAAAKSLNVGNGASLTVSGGAYVSALSGQGGLKLGSEGLVISGAAGTTGYSGTLSAADGASVNVTFKGTGEHNLGQQNLGTLALDSASGTLAMSGSIGTLTVTQGSLTVSGDTTVTTVSSSSSSLTTLTLNGVLTVNGGTLDVGTIAVGEGGGLALSVATEGGAHLKGLTTITPAESGKLTITLTGVTVSDITGQLTSDTGWTYALFEADPGLSGDLIGKLGFAFADEGTYAGHLDYELGTDGQLTVKYAAQELEGDLSGGDSGGEFTWKDQGQLGGEDGKVFDNGDSVKFTGTGTVTVEETVSAAGVEIGTADDTASVTFQAKGTGEEPADSLTIGTLKVESAESSVTFGMDASVGTLAGSGTVDVGGKTVTFTGALDSGASNTIKVDGGTLTLAAADSSAFAGKVEVGARGASLVFEGDAANTTKFGAEITNAEDDSTGGLNLSGKGTFALKGEAKGDVGIGEGTTLEGKEDSGTAFKAKGFKGVGTLSGSVEVTGNDSTADFTGTVSGLTLTVATSAKQKFSGDNGSITSATLSGELELTKSGTVAALTLQTGGNLNINDANAVITVTSLSGTAGTISGSGTLKLANTEAITGVTATISSVKLDYASAADATLKYTGSNLTISNTGALTLSDAVTGLTATMSAAGTLKLADGTNTITSLTAGVSSAAGTLDLSAVTGSSNSTTLTAMTGELSSLNLGGSTLKLGTGAFKLGALTATEGGTIGVTIGSSRNATDSTQITLAGWNLADNQKLTLHLDATSLSNLKGHEWQLFGGKAAAAAAGIALASANEYDSTDWYKSIAITHEGALASRYALYLDTAGTLHYTSLEGQVLVWDSAGADTTWNTSDTDDWHVGDGQAQADATFASATDSVKFVDSYTAEDGTTTTLDNTRKAVKFTTLTAAAMEVAGTDFSFEESDTTNHNTLTVTGELTLSHRSGKTTFKSGTVSLGSLAGSGDLAIEGGSVTITNALATSGGDDGAGNAYSGGIHLSSGASLILTNGGDLKSVDVGSEGTAPNATLTAGTGKTLTIGTLTGTGALTLNGTVTITGALSTTAPSSYTGALTVGSGNLTLTAGGTLSALTLTGTSTLTLGADLTIADPSNFAAGSASGGADGAAQYAKIVGEKTSGEGAATFSSLTLQSSSQLTSEKNVYANLENVKLVFFNPVNAAGKWHLHSSGTVGGEIVLHHKGYVILTGKIGSNSQDGQLTNISLIADNQGGSPHLELSDAEVYGDFTASGTLQAMQGVKGTLTLSGTTTVHGNITLDGIGDGEGMYVEFSGTQLTINGDVVTQKNAKGRLQFTSQNTTVTNIALRAATTMGLGTESAGGTLTVTGDLIIGGESSSADSTLSLYKSGTLTVNGALKTDHVGTGSNLTGTATSANELTIIKLEGNKGAAEGSQDDILAAAIKSVKLEKTGDRTLTLTGAIGAADGGTAIAASLDIRKGTLNLGGASSDNSNTITTSEFTIGHTGDNDTSNATVVVNTTGTKTFLGGVTVHSGSVLQLVGSDKNNRNTWQTRTGDNVDAEKEKDNDIMGEGTLELKDYDQLEVSSDSHWFTQLFSNDTSGTRSIAHVKLIGSSTLTIAADIANRLKNIKDLDLTTSSNTLTFGAGNSSGNLFGDNNGAQNALTLHIAGGNATADVTVNGSSGTAIMNRQVILGGNAAFAVTDSNTLVLSRYNTSDPGNELFSLTLGTHTLTKKESGTLQLGSGGTDVWTISKSAGAGIDVQGGTLALNYKESEDEAQLKGVKLTLAKGTTLNLMGASSSYTIEGLDDPTSVGTGEAAKVTGDTGAKLVLAGSGEHTFSGAVQVAMVVDGGTHEIGSLGTADGSGAEDLELTEGASLTITSESYVGTLSVANKADGTDVATLAMVKTGDDPGTYAALSIQSITGAGDLSLAGNVTVATALKTGEESAYTGNITLAGGTLALAGGDSLKALKLENGTTLTVGGTDEHTLSVEKLAGTGTISAGDGGSTVSLTISNSGTGKATDSSNSFGGALSGVGSITLSAGYQEFSGAYSGSLIVGAEGAGDPAAKLVMGGAVTGAVVDVKSGDTLVLNGSGSNSFSALTLAGTLTVGEGASETGVKLSLAALDGGGIINGYGALTLTDSSIGESKTFSGTLGDGNLVLVKDGTYTQILTGAVYVTDTTVKNGTLQFGTADGHAQNLTLGALVVGTEGQDATTAEVDVYSGGSGQTKSISSITIHADSTVTFHGADSLTGLSASNKALTHGKGTLEFSGMGVIDEGAVGSEKLFWFFMDNSTVTEQNTIGHLRLTKDGNTATTVTFNAHLKNGELLAHIENLWVEDGNSIVLRHVVANATTNDLLTKKNSNNTLHLAGNGSGAAINGAAAEHEGANAALYFYVSNNNKAFDTDWDIVAEGDTTIAVEAASGKNAEMTLKGKLSGTGSDNKAHTITKTKNGALILGDGFTTTDGSAGRLDIEGGSLQLAYADGTALTSYAVTLNGGSTLDVTATATTGGGYTVKYLDGTGGGTIQGADTTLTIDFDGKAFDEATNLDDGAKVTADVTRASGATSGLSLVKKGSGKQTIAGTYTGNALTVSGGELVLDGGTTTLAGAVTVTSSKLSIIGTGATTIGGGASVTGNGSALTLTGGAVTIGGAASVKDGATLTLGSWNVTVSGGVTVDGSASKLVFDFDGESLGSDKTEAHGGLALALENGATLDMSRLTCSKDVQEVHLESLTNETISAGKVLFGTAAGAGGKQVIHVGTLTGPMNFGDESHQLGAGQELHLESIVNGKDAIINVQTADGGKVFIGSIDQAEGTSGSLTLTGGNAEIWVDVQHHTPFQKTGAGSYTFGNKVNVQGGDLYMSYEGSLTWANGVTGVQTDPLTSTQLGVGGGLTLHYMDGANQTLFLESAIFDDTIFSNAKSTYLRLDINDISASTYGTGIDLGIVTDLTDEAALKRELDRLVGAEDGIYTEDNDGFLRFAETEGVQGAKFEWRDGEGAYKHLYLTLESVTPSGSYWDTGWETGGGLSGAPVNSDLNEHKWGGDEAEFRGEGTGFAGHALELLVGPDGTEEHQNKYIEGGETLIRLTAGSSEPYASVVGGKVFRTGDATSDLRYSSYINFKYDGKAANKHLHLLVGGASCLTTEGASAFHAGFTGDTHIQVEGGGEVDYIVGGNHVNNSSFTFHGDSFISVFDAEVKGGIVGGSTLTSGTSEGDLYAFFGNTHIFLYDALAGGADSAPKISDGTADESKWGAFAAVVGGNAWIDSSGVAAGSEVFPKFHGNAFITLDLTVENYQKGEDPVTFNSEKSGSFDKAIVGGNYSAAMSKTGETTTRKARFEGDTSISIIAKKPERDAQGQIITESGHVFTQGINGASRRDSAGGGATEFIGDTNITIDGGLYRNVIAGGVWFEATASGEHTLQFEGNTSITLNSGSFWRVVGGNYTLGGERTASGEDGEEVQNTARSETTGKTDITISGDIDFRKSNVGDFAFIVGGDYYDQDHQDYNKRTGVVLDSGTRVATEVKIYSGTFDDVHIVGGDYANFNGVEEKSDRAYNAEIEGTTRLTIGKAEADSLAPTINGVVVGGSYLTDTGAGGALKVSDVELTINKGTITAEQGGGHEHAGLAVVGGSMLIDTGKGGSHTMMVGDTTLNITGGTITGAVVGGSYVSDHKHSESGDGEEKQDNKLISGDVTINLGEDASITGNVVGGHYSDVQDHSDLLIFHRLSDGEDNTKEAKITINVEGADIDGNIIGGNYRKTNCGRELDSSRPLEQAKGTIEINLDSGTLSGDVFAAGWHENLAAEGATPLQSTTTLVNVTLGSGFTFAGEGEHVLSGGYRKAEYGTERDTSRVDEASLVIAKVTDAEGKDSPRDLGNVTLQDFNTITNEGDVAAKALVLSHDVENIGTFTKEGAGTLTVGAVSGAQVAGSERLFDGVLNIQGGRIEVTGGMTLGGGLQFNLTGAAAQGLATKEKPLLNVAGGLTFDTKFSEFGGEMLSLWLGDIRELAAGDYYLVGGITEAEFTTDNIGSYFDLNAEHDVEGEGEETEKMSLQAMLNAWVETQTEEGDFEARLMKRGNSLVLSLSADDPNEWVWQGDSESGTGGGTWDNNATASNSGDWKPAGEGAGEVSQAPEVYFKGSGEGEVNVTEKVTPGSVYVEGDYTFTGEGSIQLQGNKQTGEGGTLYVEGGRVELQTENNVIPKVELLDGTLALASDSALGTDTNVSMQGGVLAIEEKKTEEDGGGELYMQDRKEDLVNEKVTLPQSTLLQLQVGKTYEQFVDAVGEATTYETPEQSKGITVGGAGTTVEKAKSDGALVGALQCGVNKTGRFGLTVEWAETKEDAEYAGSITAREGNLTYKMHGGSAKLTGDIHVVEGATLGLQTADNGALEVNSPFQSEKRTDEKAWADEILPGLGEGFDARARVEIGAANDGGSYTVSANNSGFAGAIALVGNGTADAVQLADAAAVGGAEDVSNAKTDLELAGRAMVFDAAADLRGGVNVQSLKVTGTNLVGGYARSGANPNAAVTLATADGLSGDGVLANAWGNTSATNFTHTYTGKIANFEGTIVAGLTTGGQARKANYAARAAAPASEAASTSSWTLDLADEGNVTYGFNLAGTGTITMKLADAAGTVTLTGAVGSEAYGNSVNLISSGDGAHTIILTGASTSTGTLNVGNDRFELDGEGATWGGAKLTGTTGKGELTLKKGTLLQAMTEKTGAQLKVDATGVVDIGGTQGAQLDDIVVNRGSADGALVNVGGDLKLDKVQMHLYFGGSNITKAGDEKGTDLVQFANDGKKHTLKATQSPDGASGFVLDFTNEGLLDVLQEHRTDDAETWLHVTNGTLDLGDNLPDLRALTDEKASSTVLLSSLGFRIKGIESGSIVLGGTSKNVYLALGPNRSAGDALSVDTSEGEGGAYTHLKDSKAVVVDKDTAFELTFGDEDDPADEVTEVTLNNLVGLEGAELVVNDDREPQTDEESNPVDVTVKLHNSEVKDGVDDTGFGKGQITDEQGHVVNDEKKDGFDVRGVDTIFEGTIVSEDATVNFEKDGAGNLALGSSATGNGGIRIKGDLKLSDGSVTVQGGSANTMGSLVWNYGETRGKEDKGITFTNGSKTTTGDIVEQTTGEGEAAKASGGDIVINEGASLTLDNHEKEGGTTLADTTITGDGSGALEVSGSSTTTDEEGKTTYKKSTLTITDGDGKDGRETGLDGVDLAVKGGADVTVQGGAKLHDSDITVSGAAQKDSNGKPVEGASSKLTVKGSAVTGEADVTAEDGGNIVLTEGGSIGTRDEALKGDLVLKGAGSGLTVGTTSSDGGWVNLEGEASIGAGATFDLGKRTDNSVGRLTGGGEVAGGDKNRKSTLHITGKGVEPAEPGGDAFTGKLRGNGKLDVQGDAGLRLKDVLVTDKGWDVNVQENGHLAVDADQQDVDLRSLTLAGGSDLTLGYFGNGHTLKTEENLTVDSSNGKNAKLTFELNATPEDEISLGLQMTQETADKLDVGFSGLGSSHFSGTLQHGEDGPWYVSTVESDTNVWLTNGMDKNVRAGANLMWDVDSARTKAGKYVRGEGQGGDLYKLAFAISEHYNPSIYTALGMVAPIADMDRTYAAVAGSSVSTLGSAALEDVRRQAESIRNRAMMTGDADVNADPVGFRVHAWVNVDSAYHKVDADGYAPGYTLNGWGGTLGAEMEVSARSSLGLALSAMYNDLKTDSADNGKGDMDFTYVSAFYHTQHGAWSHTFVGTIGAADISLDRSVVYSADGAYRTHGDTDGFSAGLLYEVAYTKMLNPEGTRAIQPLFNVQFRYAKVNGYDETGSDAGLHVDDVTANTLTFGAGARFQSVVHENVFGRSSVFEARALVKADAGDSAGKATNSLLHGDLNQEVESADPGALGLELGAGLTLPIGSRGGTLFIDASVEIRENYTNFNAGAGYKISF